MNPDGVNLKLKGMELMAHPAKGLIDAGGDASVVTTQNGKETEKDIAELSTRGLVEGDAVKDEPQDLPQDGEKVTMKTAEKLADPVHSKPKSFDPSMSQTDCLRFQRKLFEALEELRIRRVLEKENETRIRNLVTEKHALESKYESAVKDAQVEHARQADQLAASRHSWQDKLQQLQTEKAKHAASREVLEKELEALRDEIRNLQLNKYTLENKIRQQEYKLTLSGSQQETGLAQVAAIEEKCVLLNQQLNQLIVQQEKLAANVEEAGSLNRKLMYENSHQDCESRRQQAQITSLQNALGHARLALDARPSEAAQELAQVKATAATCASQRDVALKTIEDLKSRIAEKEAELQTVQGQLGDAHGLLDRYQDTCKTTQIQTESLERDLRALRESYNDLQKECRATQQTLEKDREEHETQQSLWKQQHADLEEERDSIKGCRDKLAQTVVELEELNSEWANKNLELKNQVDGLKEELNKPKCEVGVQVVSDCKETESQTAPDVADIAIQTVSTELIETSTQTNAAITHDVTLQVQPTVEDGECQTDLLNVFADERGKTDAETMTDPVCVDDAVKEAAIAIPSASNVNDADVTVKTTTSLEVSAEVKCLSTAGNHQSDSQESSLQLFTASQEDQLSPYSRYANALKRLERKSPDKAKPTESPVSRSSFTLGSACNDRKRKLSTKYQSGKRREAASATDHTAGSPYSFRFINFPENLPKTPEKKSGVAGILQGIDRTPNSSRRVHFREQLTDIRERTPPSSFDSQELTDIRERTPPSSFDSQEIPPSQADNYVIEDASSSDDEPPSLAERIGNISSPKVSLEESEETTCISGVEI